MNHQRGSFALGMIVGLLIGLALALGVALYINKVPAPFVNKVPHRGADQDAAEAQRNKDWDPNAALAGKNPARPAAPAASGVVDTRGSDARGANSAPAASRPAADLAGEPRESTPRATDATARSGRDAAALLAGQTAASPSGRPAASGPKSTAAAADALMYFVQAGAYSRAEDAEQQRAKLAMLGLDARVTEREQSGRTVHRVRLGPFDRRDDAEVAQSRLADAKVETNLVRVDR